MNRNLEQLKKKSRIVFWTTEAILLIPFLWAVNALSDRVSFSEKPVGIIIVLFFTVITMLLIGSSVSFAATRKESKLVDIDDFDYVISIYAKNFEQVKGELDGGVATYFTGFQWHRSSYSNGYGKVISGKEDGVKFEVGNVTLDKVGVDASGVGYDVTMLDSRWLNINLPDQPFEPILLMNKKFKKLNSIGYYNSGFTQLDFPIEAVYAYSFGDEPISIKFNDSFVNYVDKYVTKKPFAIIFYGKGVSIVRGGISLAASTQDFNLKVITEESRFIKETVEVIRELYDYNRTNDQIS
ncbi:MAG: hypothetical protein RR565_07795 [Erysipelothrix sp.]